MNYEVPLYAQSQGMSCWGASIAMILAWSSGGSYTDLEIAQNVGGINYEPNMFPGGGLDPNDTYMLNRNGFEIAPRQSFSTTFIKSLLLQYGPLWVATKTPGVGPHIRVITGLTGSQLRINDPWPVGKGKKYKKSFKRFFSQMEELATEESNQSAPNYLAYLVYPMTMNSDNQSYS